MTEVKLGKDAVTLPVGTEAERPSNPVTGMIRWNTNDNALEGYDGSGWDTIPTLDFASDSDVRDGSSTNKIVTPSNIDNTIFSMGQSWVDVSSNRSFETTFTNTTGRPIMVVITLRGQGGRTISFNIDGITVWRGKSEDSNFTRTASTAVVLNGSTYRLLNPGDLVIDRWVELR